MGFYNGQLLNSSSLVAPYMNIYFRILGLMSEFLLNGTTDSQRHKGQNCKHVIKW